MPHKSQDPQNAIVQTSLTLNENIAHALDVECRRSAQGMEELVAKILRQHLDRADEPSRDQRAGVTDAGQIAVETLDSVSDGVLTFDTNGCLEYMNPGAEDLTGRSQDKALGEPLDYVLPMVAEGTDWPLPDIVQSCLQAGEPVEFEDTAVMVSASGRTLAVDGSGSPLRNETGNMVGVAVVFRDVAARRRAEHNLKHQHHNLEILVEKRTADLKELQGELLKQERLATLGHLTATVSHELRNPLGTIRNSVYSLQAELGPREGVVGKTLARIDRNIDRCTKIISELLEFTRESRFITEPVSFDGWAAELVEEMPSPGVEVVIDLSSEASVSIDAERLRQAVVNIYENAIQAMEDNPPERPAKLEVSTRVTARGAELTLVDNGHGIAAEVLDKIFEVLFSTKRFGVGLGLPTVRQVMIQHGGDVEIESEPNVETRTVLWLPSL